MLKNCTKINYVSKALYNYTTGDSFSLIEKTYSDYSKKCEMVYEAWMDLLVQFENKELYLEKKANKFVEQCKYYAFERDVNLKKFLKN